MSILFVSHSSSDDKLAEQLKIALAARGYNSIFLDFDPDDGIQAGETWQTVLYRKLRSCQALVAIVTDGFLASKWCFAEVALARMHGKQLFGIRAVPLASDAEVPALLSDRQLVDGRVRLDDAVDRLVKRMEQIGLSSKAARAWDRSRSPYPGFSAFTTADWGIFFGRDAEIESGLEIIRGAIRGTASRLALILGASGSGKSSLLRAGIAHRLQDEEAVSIVGPFRPRGDPLDALEASVAQAFGQTQAPRQDAGLGRWLRRIMREQGLGHRHVVIAIDQFEELLGRPEGHDADTFLSLMVGELTDEDSEITFVGTLRSDQLPALQSHRIGRELEWQSLFVGPLDKSKLREIIEEPARLAELELEKGLADRLIEDTREVHALPLLALTLRRLWEKGGADGFLEVREYEALGGIHGAVARVANDALAGVRDTVAIEGLKDALLRMVRLDAQQNAVQQPITWASTRAAARPLLKRLVTSRLLVRENGELQVAHEALFTAWDRLRDWIDESRQALLVHRQVADAARLWEPDRLDTDLWRGARLDRAVELQDAGLLPLDAIEEAFLKASVEAQTIAREEKRREARQRERLSRVAMGRGLAYQALGEAADRPQRGLLLAVEAARATYDAALPVTAAAETALQNLLNRLGGESLADFGSKVTQIAFDSSGVRLAVGCEDGTIAILSYAQTGAIEKRWQAHASAVNAIELVGQTVVSRSADGRVCVWDIKEDDKVGCLEVNKAENENTRSAFCAARSLLAVAAADQPPLLYDLASGTRWLLEGADSMTTALGFSPDGQWLVDGRENGQLVLWALAALPEQPTHLVIKQHEEPIKHVVWAAEAAVFVTADKGNQMICRWSAGNEPGQINLSHLQSSGSQILDLAVSADGGLVVVGTWHSEGFCWSADNDFTQPVTLQGHSSSIRSVDISPDGRWIVTGSPRDNFVLLWPADRLHDGLQAIALRGEDRWIAALAFAPDGTIVAGSWAGTVRRWRQLTISPEIISIPGVDLNRYALSWDGRVLISAGAWAAIGGEIDSRGKMVNLKNGAVEPVQHPEVVTAVCLTPNGRWSAAAGDGKIRVLDQETGKDTVLAIDAKGWFKTLALDPSGRWLVSGEQDTLFLLDMFSNGTRHKLAQHQDRLVSAVFDASGQRLLTADAAGRVVLWAYRKEQFVLQKTWKHDGVWWCGFVRDGDRWVSGAASRILTGSTSADDDEIARIETGWQGNEVRFALARKSGRIVAGTNLDVASWDLAADDPAASRMDLPRHEGFIDAIAVSSDGRRIATSMTDGPIRLWHLDSPNDPVSLPRQQSHVMLLEFVAEDRLLVSGQSGSSLAIWNLDIDQLLNQAINVAGRKLTEAERERFLAAR